MCIDTHIYKPLFEEGGQRREPGFRTATESANMGYLSQLRADHSQSNANLVSINYELRRHDIGGTGVGVGMPTQNHLTVLPKLITTGKRCRLDRSKRVWLNVEF